MKRCVSLIVLLLTYSNLNPPIYGAACSDTKRTYHVGKGGCQLHLTDINGDSQTDIVCLNSEDLIIPMLINGFDGRGDFSLRILKAYKDTAELQIIDKQYLRIEHYAMARINDDETLDVATLIHNRQKNTYSIVVHFVFHMMLQDDDVHKIQYPLNDPSYHFALGHLDNNTDVDAVIANYMDHKVTLYFDVNGRGFTDNNRREIILYDDVIDDPSDNLQYQPSKIYLADINNDNKQDIVVLLIDGPVDFVMFENKGDASASTTNIYQSFEYKELKLAVEEGPIASVEFTDFDRDGDLDLVCNRIDDVVISKNKGEGSGDFQSDNLIVVPMGNSLSVYGHSPIDIALADVNGDQFMDIVGTSWGNSISMRLSMGRETQYSDIINYGMGMAPTSIAVADLNGDAYPDLVTSDYDTVTVRMHTRTNGYNIYGQNLFPILRDYPIVYHPSMIELSDFDGNGLSDILMLHTGDNMTIHVNKENGSFVQAASLDAGPEVVKMDCTFLDDDDAGEVDIVVANKGTSTLTVFYNIDCSAQAPDTACTFRGKKVMPTAPDVRTFVAEDIDVNGRMDIVSIGSDLSGNCFLYIHWNNTDDLQIVPLAIKGDVTQMKSSDIDEDGFGDLIIGSHDDGEQELTIYYNIGASPYFSEDKKSTHILPHVPKFIMTGDLDSTSDGNHCLDVLTMDDRGNLSALYHPASGTATSPQSRGPIPDDTTIHSTTILPRVMVFPRDVRLADINDDTYPDLVTANTFTNNISVLFNNQSRKFVQEEHYAMGLLPTGLAIGDINGDNIPDIASINARGDIHGNSSFSVRLNKLYASLPAISDEEAAQADINSDNIIDFEDFSILSERWHDIVCGGQNQWCDGADIDENGSVAFLDLVLLSQYWLWEPQIPVE